MVKYWMFVTDQVGFLCLDYLGEFNLNSDDGATCDDEHEKLEYTFKDKLDDLSFGHSGFLVDERDMRDISNEINTIIKKEV